MEATPKRVFLISEYYPPNQIGGAEVSTERLAQTLAAGGARVTVITINFQNFRVRRDIQDCLEVIFIPFLFHLCSRKWRNILFRSWVFYFFFAVVLTWFSMRRRPAVLHAQNKHVLIPTFIAGKLLRLPIAFTVRDTMVLCPSGICLTDKTKEHDRSFAGTLKCLSDLHEIYTGSSHMNFLNLISASMIYVDTRMKQWVMKRCTTVIFVSNELRRIFIGHNLTSSNMKVVYNIPPQSGQLPTISSPVISRLEDFKREGGKIVLTVGKLSFGKGTQVLLNAIPHVISHFPNTRFVFAGRAELTFPCDPNLKEKIDFLGSVPIEFVALLYDLADVVCQPSIWPEPLSRTLLEALAFGKPVVATSVGGTPEVVAHEETGLLVPPQESDSLASAITRLLCNQDYASWLGQRGKQQLGSRFDPSVLAARHLELYGGLT